MILKSLPLNKRCKCKTGVTSSKTETLSLDSVKKMRRGLKYFNVNN